LLSWHEHAPRCLRPLVRQALGTAPLRAYFRGKRSKGAEGLWRQRGDDRPLREVSLGGRRSGRRMIMLDLTGVCTASLWDSKHSGGRQPWIHPNQAHGRFELHCLTWVGRIQASSCRRCAHEGLDPGPGPRSRRWGPLPTKRSARHRWWVGQLP